MLTTLLWDVDGTLADTERDGHRVAFNQAFAEAGLDWNWSVELYKVLLRVTGGKERIQFYVECYCPQWQTPDLPALAARLHQRKTYYYVTLLVQGAIPLRLGVARLLTEARQQGIRMGIVTTTTPANVTALLRSTLGDMSLEWFECIAAGDIVPRKKPAPDIYAYALQQMGVTAHECLALEDSDNGLQSALGAGIKTLITVNEYTADQNFKGACAVLSDLGEPDQATRVLVGSIGSASYVTLDALRELSRYA